jgi:hypothetical protein
MNRRRFLTGSVAGTLGLTGCLRLGGSEESTPASTETSTATSGSTSTATPTATSGSTSTATPTGTDAATPESSFPADSCLAAMTEDVPDPLYGFEFGGSPSPEVGGKTATTSGAASVGNGIATFPNSGGEIRLTDVQAVDDLTVSLFARPAVAASDQWNVMLWYSPTDRQWSGWGVEHGKGAVDFWVEGPEESATEVLTKSSSNLPTGTWSHIVGVKRGTTTTLYVDGQQAATANFPSGSISYGGASSIDMVLGRHAGSGVGDRYHQGDLDSVAVWDGALSESQIQTLLSVGSSCR